MPTFKHPCPHCDTFINRDVVACPKCGTRDPFAPGRCPACSAPIEDRSWVACPKCGGLVGSAAVAAANAAAGAAPVPASSAPGAIPGWGQAPATPPASTPPVATLPVAPATPAPPPLPALPVAPATPVEGAPCPACGSALAQGARFCRDCGAPVS